MNLLDPLGLLTSADSSGSDEIERERRELAMAFGKRGDEIQNSIEELLQKRDQARAAIWDASKHGNGIIDESLLRKVRKINEAIVKLVQRYFNLAEAYTLAGLDDVVTSPIYIHAGAFTGGLQGTGFDHAVFSAAEDGGKIGGGLESVMLDPIIWRGLITGGIRGAMRELVSDIFPSASNSVTSNPGKRGGETPATIDGRRAHNNYGTALGSGYDTKVTLPSGKKPDAVNYQTREVRELKPANERAVRRGENQVEGYRKELEEITGENWTGKVDTYNSQGK